ncbi:TonB-dependent receptor [Aquabacterium sp.]|uniref:TonB-dependent receptor n=1 Tax=Aquabacterium sp. TaxID=1872578 RepID=UPI002C31C8F4|nr:TonB-dependent receptor [Aquabacterium sp.]HSW08928.1 TonB-dependent receptor [Aquabacterium sp.]
MNVQGFNRRVLALALLSAYPMHGALAQTSAAATDKAKKDDTQLQEIIVTGTRRLENIKDVPQSISTINSEALETLNASGLDIRALSARVPSLNIESDFGRTFPRFYIRGQGNTDFDLNASQPVGLVLDDVVQENPILKGFPLFDVAQVEVLRGPQGTLFGRNSPAGVLKFDSVAPGKREEGYFTIGFGRYGALNLEGAVNLPLGPDWSIRASAISQSADDRVYNSFPGGEPSLEGYTDRAARVQAAYTNGNFNALFNLHGRDFVGNATTFRANIIKRGTNELVDGFDFSSYPSDGLNSQTLNSLGASARLRWDLGGITLNSITAFDRARYYSRGDVDGGLGSTFGGVPNGPDYPGQPALIPFDAQTADGVPWLRQFTQEFRAASNTKDPLQWLGGVYYFREKLQVDSFNFDSFAVGDPQNGYAVQQQRSSSHAAFGSLSYAISDALKIRGGIRYTSDKKEFEAARTQTPFGGANVGPLTANPSSNNTSWDLGASYAINKSTTVFGRVATGYRAPSIQGRVLFGDTISVADAEKALSFEAGFKVDLFNNTTRLSGTVFRYQVKDLQLTAGSGSVNQNRLVNADKAQGQGFELDLQANINRHWKTTAGISFNDTEIKDPNLFVAPCGNANFQFLRPNTGCTVTDPAGPVAGTVLIGGNPLPRAPKWIVNWTLKYSVELGNGDLYVVTDWAYKDKYNMFLYEAKEYTAKSLLEGGLRIGYAWANGKYEVAAYSRNITNRQQVVAAIDFNNLTGILNEPRSWGLQFRASY